MKIITLKGYMDNEIIFTERQKYRQWWLWLILFVVNAFFFYGFFKQFIRGQQFGSKPMIDVIILTGLTVILTVKFAIFRLDTQIKMDGIYIRLFPFQFSFKKYSWDNLTKAYVRQYSPIGEFGGWGIRFGLFGTGNAYNVSGDMGLQLEFTTNKKLLVGTKKADELKNALYKIGQLKQ